MSKPKNAEVPKNKPSDVLPVVEAMAKLEEDRVLAIRKKVDPKSKRLMSQRILMALDGYKPEELVALWKEIKEKHGNLRGATTAWRQEAADKGQDPLIYVARRTAALTDPERLQA